MWIYLLACSDLLEPPPEPNCADRVAYYRDENEDGVGDAGTIYWGCSQPDGYVTVPPTEQPDDTGVE